MSEGHLNLEEICQLFLWGDWGTAYRNGTVKNTAVWKNEVITDTVQNYFIISGVLAHLCALASSDYDLAAKLNLQNKHDILISEINMIFDADYLTVKD